MQFLLFSVALQNRLTAGSMSLQLHLWRFEFIQVLSDARPMHCSTGQGKKAPLLFSAALQTSLTCLCHCNYTYGDLLFIQVYIDQATKHCSKVQGKMQIPLFSVALQNRLAAGSLSLQLHLWRSALRTAVQ